MPIDSKPNSGAGRAVVGAAQNAIGTGEPKLVRISNDRIQPEADVEQHAMSCVSNGTIELFIHRASAGMVSA